MDLVCKSYFFLCLFLSVDSCIMRNMSWTCHHSAPPTNPNGWELPHPSHMRRIFFWLSSLKSRLRSIEGDWRAVIRKYMAQSLHDHIDPLLPYLLVSVPSILELKVPIEEDLDVFILQLPKSIGIIGTSHWCFFVACLRLQIVANRNDMWNPKPQKGHSWRIVWPGSMSMSC